MTAEPIEVTPIAGALGAEIEGVDLSGDLGNAAFDAVHRAFLDHQVLVFRGQDLTPHQQVAFAARFGKPAVYPFIESIPGVPEVIEILKTETDTINFGRFWHSDTTYMAEPCAITMLYSREAPAFGGDTMFASMYSAYDALSDGMKALLDGRHARNSSAQNDRGGRAAKMRQFQAMKDSYVQDAEALEALHPVVRTHPETGRKALYVNGSHTVCFDGATEAESKPILGYLAEHAVRPEFTCRVRWAVGTLVMWDNRCVQHIALNDYNGQRRRMHRVMVEGDRPA